MTKRCRSVTTLAGLAVAALLVAGEEAEAAPYSVLLESNVDRATNEIYLANYASLANLISNTLDGSSAYSTLNVSSAFSVGGYTQVNEGYSVLLESNADRSTNEIYLANYASYDGLINNALLTDVSNPFHSAYSTLNVSSAFSVGGYTYGRDGFYSVLLESNADRTTNEIYIARYASYDDLLKNNLHDSSSYSALNVSSAFSVGGFSYDGSGGYSVLLESDLDRVNNEIYLANYASFDDLISNTLASTSAYSTLNVSSAFSVGGLAIDWDEPGVPSDPLDPDGDFPDGKGGNGDGRGGNPDGGPGNPGGLGGNPDDDQGDGGGPGGTPIPEPTTLSLVTLAGFGLAARRRRMYRQNS